MIGEDRMRQETSLTEDIRLLASLQNKYRYTDEKTRSYLEEHRVFIPRNDFYSDYLSVSEINHGFEHRVTKQGKDRPTFDLALPAPKSIRATLRTLAPFAKELFSAAAASPSFDWNNPNYRSLDVVLLYSMIRAVRPAKVVEIGSGASTAIIQRAIERNEHGSLCCIDPNPRAAITPRPFTRHIAEPVQDADIQSIIPDADLVFYDGSHTVKPSSDAVFFFLCLLPLVRPQTILHCHDIYLPYSIPREMLVRMKINWGEQYLLCALIQSGAYSSIISSHLLTKRFAPQIKSSFPKLSDMGPVTGSSFWFSKGDTAVAVGSPAIAPVRP